MLQTRGSAPKSTSVSCEARKVKPKQSVKPNPDSDGPCSKISPGNAANVLASYGVPVFRREPKRRLALARIFTSYGFFSFLVHLLLVLWSYLFLLFLFSIKSCSASDRHFDVVCSALMRPRFARSYCKRDVTTTQTVVARRAVLLRLGR